MLGIKPYRKKRNNPEAQTQVAFFEWLSYYPKLRASTFAIPNGGSRHALEALNLKRQGVTAGTPDVFLAMPNKIASGAFIEFKAGKNRLTKEQQAMMEILKANGYTCFVCYSLNDAREALTKYLSNSFCPNL